MKLKLLSFFLIVFLVLTPLTFLQLAYAPVIPEAYVYCNNYVAGSWTNPTYAYNNNTANGATIAWTATGYCAYLTLNLSNTARGSKIQYWVGRSNTVITTMQIWIANQTGAWTQVYSATPTYGAYANATITFSQYTALRFRFSKTGTASRTATVYETQAVNNSYTVPDYIIDLSQWDSVFKIPYFTFAYGSIVVGSDANGVELNLTLPSNPASSTFAINFGYANLSFHYQAPLDEELNVSQYDSVNATHAIRNGKVIIYRPENIVGSYAVYGMHRDNEYGTGKVFHLYRPLIIDKNGATSWGTLALNLLNETNGMLAITTNPTWMNSASYPVVIDPTFGRTTVGGSWESIGAEAGGFAAKCALTETGTVTQLEAYMVTGSGTGNVCGAVYNGSTVPSKRQGSGGSTISVTTTAAWRISVIASGQPTLTAASYWLAYFGDATDWQWAMDSTGGTSYYGYHAFAGEPAATWDLTGGGAITELISIFANYTTAGGPTAYTVDLTKTFTVALTKSILTNYNLVTTQAITSAFLLQAIGNYPVLLTQSITNDFVFNALTGYNVILNEATTLGLLFTSLSNYNVILTQGTTLGLDTLPSLVYYVTLAYGTTLSMTQTVQTVFNIILSQGITSGFLFTSLSNYNLILTQGTTLGLSSFNALVYYVTLSLTANLGLLQYFQTAYNIILSQTVTTGLNTLVQTAYNLILQSTWTTGLLSYAVNATTFVAYIVDLAWTTTLTMTQLFATAFNLFITAPFNPTWTLPSLFPSLIPTEPTGHGGITYRLPIQTQASIIIAIVSCLAIGIIAVTRHRDTQTRTRTGKRKRRPITKKKPRLEPRRKFPQPERKFPQPEET